jgi:hypothetical protein
MMAVRVKILVCIGASLSGWVAHNGRNILNGNPTVEFTYLAETGLLNASSSAISIPLFDRAGIIFGMLARYAVASTAFSKGHFRLSQDAEPRFSLALQNALRAGVETGAIFARCAAVNSELNRHANV